MRNAILSILIFLLTITCVYFLNNSILSLCDSISLQAEDIESKITSGKMEEAYSQSLELLDSIEKNSILTSIYLNHQEFDNLLDESLRLCTYLIHNDATDAHTSLHLVKHSIDHIKNLQMPNFENIL